MKPIPIHLIEEAWAEMEETATENAAETIAQLTNEQPIMLAYLMAAGYDFLNQDEREFFLYLGIVIWQAMKNGATPLPVVTETFLDACEDKNMKMLEYLETETEAEFDNTIETIVANYNQKELLKDIIDAVFEEPEPDEDIRPENMGLLVIFLKTVIDCFDS